jgi:apolipoprotein N-acyltransferase
VAALQTSGAGSPAAHARKLFAMTRQAATQGARLIIWPEGALSVSPWTTRTADFQALARETNAFIVVGYGYHTAGGLANEAVVISPAGELLPPYAKDHPVVWMGETSATRGTYPAHPTPLGTIGTVICYDLNFTDTARKIAANGAQIIAVPSNDWPAMAAKQYTNLVMRAVENRVALVKADTRYDSAVIGPTGAIIARQVSSVPFQAILVADVPLGRANAPLIWLGDWVGWLCVGGLVAFLIFGAANQWKINGRLPSIVCKTPRP